MKYDKAFTLFKSGNFVEAFHLSLNALKEGKYQVHETPYLQCRLVNTFLIYQTGKKDVAFKEIINLMQGGMDDFDIRYLM